LQIKGDSNKKKYFIKGLGDIKKGCGAVGFVCKGFIDFVDDAMCLFSGGVVLPEAELMERD
jgi:hypothetical protein